MARYQVVGHTKGVQNLLHVGFKNMKFGLLVFGNLNLEIWEWKTLESGGEVKPWSPEVFLDQVSKTI